MAIIVDKIINTPVVIIDGYVDIYLSEYGLHVKQAVKQIKGRGVFDADRLVIPNHYHIELLNLLKNIPETGEFTANQLLSWTKLARQKSGKLEEFKEANWRRAISELLRKKILISTTKRRYKIDIKLVTKTLETSKF